MTTKMAFRASQGHGRLTIQSIAYHRNGVTGNGFHVVLFDERNGRETDHMTGIVFSEPGNCAVLDRDKLAEGKITYEEGNRWRGDDYEPELRQAIEANWEAEKLANAILIEEDQEK